MKHTLTALLATMVSAHAVNILSPSDFIIGIGAPDFSSNHPGGEPPENIIDGDSATKYLNFSKENSGFIVTPGASVAESIVFTTANDSDERDPATFSIWGTNDSITSPDGGFGSNETWSPILSGAALNLPTVRGAAGSPVNLSNGTSFSSYRVSFDSLRNGPAANSMQIAEAQLFTGANGSGTSILGPSNSIIAFDFDTGAASDFPGGEAPSFAIDGDPLTKYLNFRGGETGFIVTPASGPSVIDSFVITTAGDAPDRDPVGYTLFGTNDAITSAENSDGSAENWIVIQSGSLTPPGGRGENYGDSVVGNTTEFSSYRFDVDTTNGGPLMQFAEIQFLAIPEPSTALLGMLGALGLLRRRR